MKLLFISLISGCISFSAYTADLTQAFQSIYKDNKELSKLERDYFSQFDFYLVPGILSESFIDDDHRSYLELSFLTGNYFEGEYKTLSKKYGLKTERLSPSSLSVDETKKNIQVVIEKSRKANRKAVFICHSLGGVSLLEEIVENRSYQGIVGAVFFLQSPFSGTPVADVFVDNTNPDSKTLGAILAYLNLSHETVEFLSTSHRKQFMSDHKAEITLLMTKIPVITLGGVANGHFTLFKPSLGIIDGPSDGMVPFESSKLPGTDFVKLDRADHGELVVRIPFDNFKKERLTETMLKMLYLKMK